MKCQGWVEDLARSHLGVSVSVCSLIALCLDMKGVSEKPAACCGRSGVVESVGVGLRDRRLRHHVWLPENDEGTAKTTTTTTITAITTTLRTFSGDAATYKATCMVAMPSWPPSSAFHPRDFRQQTPGAQQHHARTRTHVSAHRHRHQHIKQ
jgi:hypothetical protein